MSEATSEQIFGNWNFTDQDLNPYLQDWKPVLPKKDTPLKFSPERQQIFDRIIVESSNDIGKYIPHAAPNEQTHFFILPGFDQQVGNQLIDGGEYLGKFGQKHYITLRLPNNKVESSEPFTPEEEEALRIAIQHELLHQAHAERIGQMQFFKSDYSNLPNGNELSFEEIMSLKDQRPSNKSKGGASIFSAVTEGAATLGELYLVGKRIEEMRQSGDTLRASLLEKLKADRLKYLVNALRIYHIDPKMSSHMFGGPYAIGVIKLMHGLYKKYGIESIVDIIQKIDLDKCRNIRAEDSEFGRICADPSLLPGLENK